MISIENILFILLSYLTGSFPSAVWVGKTFFNKDVREYGSGNAGATNTFRVLGKKAGIPVLLMDVFKGCLSVNYILFVSNVSSLSPSQYFEIQLAFGISAVIGHLFPIYTGFRGGKGIATLLGLLIGLSPYAAIIALIVFITVVIITKYVSVSSIIASISYPIIIFFIFEDSNYSLQLFSIFVPILSLITHQKNIERLFRGEENKISFEKNN